MAQDAVDHARLCNNGDDLHPGAAFADQRVNFENFPQQPSPCPAGFSGEVGILIGRAGLRCDFGEILYPLAGCSRAVAIGTVVALTMPAGIWDMGGYVPSCYNSWFAYSLGVKWLISYKSCGVRQ